MDERCPDCGSTRTEVSKKFESKKDRGLVQYLYCQHCQGDFVRFPGHEAGWIRAGGDFVGADESKSKD